MVLTYTISDINEFSIYYILSEKDENSVCNSSLECKATLQCKKNHCVCCQQEYWNGHLCEISKSHNSYFKSEEFLYELNQE